MTSSAKSSTESIVQFLNVDVELFGAFDRGALLNGFGNAIVVLHEGGDTLGEPSISFEVSSANRTLSTVISELIALVSALPEDARAAWDLANRRVFDIGIQAGLGPRCTAWTLSAEMLSALAAIKAEVTLTIYGADIGATSPTSVLPDDSSKQERNADLRKPRS